MFNRYEHEYPVRGTCTPSIHALAGHTQFGAANASKRAWQTFRVRWHMFADRIEAGKQLAAALAAYRHPRLLVLGLPRGGVVVASVVAAAMDAELDVVLCKKLRAPDNPELAIGAVCEGGGVFLNADVVEHLEIESTYIEHEKAVRLDEMKQQVDAYRRVKPPASVLGRPVIVIDDGLATGATMMAAVQTAARARPATLVVAVPGGAVDSVRKLEAMRDVDGVVCLETPSFFYGVGQLYDNFDQVADEEVMRLLA